jgi:PAS domain S-box-containing protein
MGQYPRRPPSPYRCAGPQIPFGASKKQADIHAITPVLVRVALLTCAVFLIPGIFISLALSRRLTRPITRLADAATAIRRGDLESEIVISGSREISVVSDNLNQMRESIARHVELLTDAIRKLEELKAIIDKSPVVVYRLEFIPGRWPVEFISENISLLGYTADELTSGSVPWASLTHPEDLASVEALVKRKVEEDEDAFNIEARILAKNGRNHWMQSWNRFIRNETGEITHIYGIFTDITELKIAQQRMADIIDIVNSSPLYLFSLRLDSDFSCDFISENIARSGYPATAFTSGPVDWEKMIPAEDLELGINAIAATIDAGSDSYTIDSRMIWANGEVHWHRNWNRILRDAEGNPTHVQGLLTDVTGEKEAHERDIQYRDRLKALTMQLMQAEDTERRQLAIALHDDIGQMLAALNMKFSVLKETTDRARIDDLVRQVDELHERIMNTCKSLTLEISPPSLYESDINAGLERMAGDLKTYFGLNVGVSTEGERIEADRELSALIFRCAKELLVNIAKHSGAKTAKIGISRQGCNLHLVVADEGRGFNPEELENGSSAGFGLFSIRERMLHIGGSMHIESQPGYGTRVMIVFPQVAVPGTDAG